MCFIIGMVQGMNIANTNAMINTLCRDLNTFLSYCPSMLFKIKYLQNSVRFLPAVEMTAIPQNALPLSHNKESSHFERSEKSLFSFQFNYL